MSRRTVSTAPVQQKMVRKVVIVTGVHHNPQPVRKKLNLRNPDNILRPGPNNHNLVFVDVPRLKGKCVNCLKNGKTKLEKITTCCDTCEGANWMCDMCFEELHNL